MRVLVTSEKPKSFPVQSLRWISNAPMRFQTKALDLRSPKAPCVDEQIFAPARLPYACKEILVWHLLEMSMSKNISFEEFIPSLTAM